MWAASPSLVLVPCAFAAAGLAAAAAGLRGTAIFAAACAMTWPGAPLVVGPTLGYVLGLILGPMWPLAAGLLCVRSVGGNDTLRVRWAVIVPGVVAATAGWWRAVVYQGFDDPTCRRSCDVSPLLVTSHIGLAHTLVLVGALAAAVLWAAVLVALVAAIVMARDDAPNHERALTALVGVTAAASLGEAWTRTAGASLEVPAPPTIGLHLASGVGALCFVVTSTWLRVRLVRALRKVRQVFTEGEAGGVTRLLSVALRDPAVVVGHFVEGFGYVDRTLHVMAPATPGRRRTELLDVNGPIAVIEHAASVPPALLAAQVGPAVRTAIQNEGLELRLEREVAALAESRRRIVDHGEAERVRLERDLHDGAQQGVLALSLEVSRLRSRAAELGDQEAEAFASAAADAAQTLLERLRVVARGIHPAVLEGGGLEPALRQLADGAAAPFFLSTGSLDGLSKVTQRAAFAIARDSTLAHIDTMRVALDGELVISVDSPDPVPVVLCERAAGLAAAITTTATGWEVRIPCA